jgi:hypothetical protein
MFRRSALNLIRSLKSSLEGEPSEYTRRIKYYIPFMPRDKYLIDQSQINDLKHALVEHARCYDMSNDHKLEFAEVVQEIRPAHILQPVTILDRTYGKDLSKIDLQLGIIYKSVILAMTGMFFSPALFMFTCVSSPIYYSVMLRKPFTDVISCLEKLDEMKAKQKLTRTITNPKINLEDPIKAKEISDLYEKLNRP